MAIELTIVYEHDEDTGWWTSSIPEVPGAISQGRSRDEAREMALDALRELSLARRELILKQNPNADTEPIDLAS